MLVGLGRSGRLIWSISTYFRPDWSWWLGAMTKKLNKLTTKKATTINMWAYCTLKLWNNKHVTFDQGLYSIDFQQGNQGHIKERVMLLNTSPQWGDRTKMFDDLSCSCIVWYVVPLFCSNTLLHYLVTMYSLRILYLHISWHFVSRVVAIYRLCRKAMRSWSNIWSNNYAHIEIVVNLIVVNLFSFLVIAPSPSGQSGRK